MPRLSPALAPSVSQSVAALGVRLKALRLSKNISTVQAARELGITRVTLARLERGDPGTSMAVYASAMHYLGVESDLNLLVSASSSLEPTGGRATEALAQTPARAQVLEERGSVFGDASGGLPTSLL